MWTPKSAPPSPSADRKFRPVRFESPSLPRKNQSSTSASGTTSPAPWTQPDYPNKPYEASIIKSSSLSTISSPKIQQQNHITIRKARGKKV